MPSPILHTLRLSTLLLACALTFLLPSGPASGFGRPPDFSSAYTDLKTQCRPVAKGEPQGDDTPLRCDGYGGYELRIDFSAASSHLRVQQAAGGTEDAIDLAEQPLNYDSKRKVEWRLADGKPFAVILRVDKPREGVDPSEMWRPANKVGEALIVKGLKGYERIDFEVDARTPDANAKARELADKAYAGDQGGESKPFHTEGTFSNITAGPGGDYGGIKVYLTDSDGDFYATVTIAEGVLRPPVLVKVQAQVEERKIAFALPRPGGQRKFTGVVTADGLTLFEGGNKIFLKRMCLD